MKVDVSKDQVFERKADGRGRVSLPASKYKNCEVEVIVTKIEEVSDSE